MKNAISRSSLLTMLVIVALAAAVPFAVVEFMKTGECFTCYRIASRMRLFVPHPTWEDFPRLAFDEIRFCGATSVQVMRRMRGDD